VACDALLVAACSTVAAAAVPLMLLPHSPTPSGPRPFPPPPPRLRPAKRRRLRPRRRRSAKPWRSSGSGKRSSSRWVGRQAGGCGGWLLALFSVLVAGWVRQWPSKCAFLLPACVFTGLALQASAACWQGCQSLRCRLTSLLCPAAPCPAPSPCAEHGRCRSCRQGPGHPRHRGWRPRLGGKPRRPGPAGVPWAQLGWWGGRLGC